MDKENKNTIERNLNVNGIIIVHLKSIFCGHIPLDKALSNIIVRKISKLKNEKDSEPY